MHHIEWGDAAAWAAAIFTGGALFAALWQINTERAARKTAEAKGERHAHRAQAELLSAWWGGPVTPGSTEQDWLVLSNRSDEPVYRAVAALVWIQGAAPHTSEELTRDLMGEAGWAWGFIAVVSVLPPGLWRVRVSGAWGAMMARPGAEIAFTDRAGTHWIRRANGPLEELATEPVDHLGIPGPFDFATPEPYE